MANKSLFQSLMGRLIPRTDTVNDEWAPAYAMTPKQSLAQFAATGCLNRTFYATPEDQLIGVLNVCKEVDPGFIARTAIYCREKAFMKDMPSLLCAILSVRDSNLLASVFERVIDNGRMLRTFVQIVRSGAVGRKSLGSLPKKMILRWIEAQSDNGLFHASVGNDPSLADIVKMVHPRPKNPVREALYGYLIGRAHDSEALPESVKQYEEFKAGKRGEVPNVPFQMLTSLELGTTEWTAIARNAPWQMTRMNLNTFARNGVFKQPGMAQTIADRLRDPEAIAKARVFPYQLMVAFKMAGDDVPDVVRDALQDAMEIAIRNVPALEGKVYVCPDVSSSMASPVTGSRKGATSVVSCIDVAALMAASVLRKNPTAEIIPFETDVVRCRINPRDSVMTNAARLAAIRGGGTNCSAPLVRLNRKKALGDLVVYVSDNQSWVDAGGQGTALLREWNIFKKRNPNARLVCIDIQPGATTQAVEREDIVNVGGFSDTVFTVISEFAAGRLSGDHWIKVIEDVKL